ncbi:MAG: hypothetical protein GQ581_08010, partial [Methyloprofundus sp.]|nr:hypothetical protein [Methyloprofundus sp.]
MTIFKQHRMLLLLSFILALNTTPSWAKKTKQTDFIALAAMMLKDGHNDRALMALQSVDMDDTELDLARFYTLQGMAYMNLNDMPAAVDNLKQAVRYGQKDPVIYVYLAQAHYALKDYQHVITAVDNAATIISKYPTLLEIQAQAYWKLQQPGAAIAALNKGQALMPDDYRFIRRKVFYLVALKLYQQAAQLGQHYLQVSAAKASDYIAIGNALR